MSPAMKGMTSIPSPTIKAWKGREIAPHTSTPIPRSARRCALCAGDMAASSTSSCDERRCSACLSTMRSWQATSNTGAMRPSQYENAVFRACPSLRSMHCCRNYWTKKTAPGIIRIKQYMAIGYTHNAIGGLRNIVAISQLYRLPTVAYVRRCIACSAAAMA